MEMHCVRLWKYKLLRQAPSVGRRKIEVGVSKVDNFGGVDVTVRTVGLYSLSAVVAQQLAEVSE